MSSNYIYIFIGIVKLHICTHTFSQGDSGNGLICDNILSAIVSFGRSCGDPVFPGVHVDVSGYRKFIDETIRLNYKQPKSDEHNQSSKMTDLSNTPIFIVVVTIGLKFG